MTRYLHRKLSLFWKEGTNWKIILIGKGFYEFQFNSIEDMRKIWALGVVNLNPGLLRFMKWTNDFNPMNQTQTHTQLWIRLLDLPQEYWRDKTLIEIASAIGTPLSIDENTKKRLFGHLQEF